MSTCPPWEELNPNKKISKICYYKFVKTNNDASNKNINYFS